MGMMDKYLDEDVYSTEVEHMSNVITGKIDKIYVDERNTRFGVKEATTFVIDGQKYSGGFKKYTVKEGDVVTVSYDMNGAYKNVTALSLTSPATTATTSSNKGRGGRMAGEEGGFPLHPLAYERALDRRNALNAAIVLATNKAAALDNKDYLTEEYIINAARKFEAYTTGDLERMEAEKEMAAESGDSHE